MQNQTGEERPRKTSVEAAIARYVRDLDRMAVLVNSRSASSVAGALAEWFARNGAERKAEAAEIRGLESRLVPEDRPPLSSAETDEVRDLADRWGGVAVLEDLARGLERMSRPREATLFRETAAAIGGVVDYGREPARDLERSR